MKRSMLLFSLFLTLCTYTAAQHCPYCGGRILVVEICEKGDSIPIEGLSISLHDSTGAALFTPRWNGMVFKQDTMRLWSNPRRTTMWGLIDNNNPMDPKRMRFPFAEENYIWLGHYIEGSFIRIWDPDFGANRGAYATTDIPLDPSDFHSLCTGRSAWDRGGEFVEGYAPKKVFLERAY